MATADLTVIALGRPDASASEYIAAIQRKLAEQERVKYVMHAMGTSLEGSTADILAVVGELHAVPFKLRHPACVHRAQARRAPRQGADACRTRSTRCSGACKTGDSRTPGAVPFTAVKQHLHIFATTR